MEGGGTDERTEAWAAYDEAWERYRSRCHELPKTNEIAHFGEVIDAVTVLQAECGLPEATLRLKDAQYRLGRGEPRASCAQDGNTT